MINLEVLEFYPLVLTEKELTGTLRIKLPDLGIHILGIYVSRRNGIFYFSMPSKKGTDCKTGNGINYPIFVFEDKQKHQELLSEIRLKGPEFIERRLADTENPLILPETQQPYQKQSSLPQVKKDPEEAKETVSVDQKPVQPVNPVKSITEKKWVDLPPRKVKARTQSNGGIYARR